MAHSAPRWEYRIWCDLPSALPRGSLEERTDTYLVRPGLQGRMVKLRDGRFDVKDLHEVEDGMELWQPREPRGFPLPAGQVAAALVLDDTMRRGLDRRFEGPATLQASLRRGTDVTPVALHKRRVRWTEAGCQGETVQVLLDDVWHESRALEHEDRRLLGRTVDALGWRLHRNESYGAWLARSGSGDQPAMLATSA